MNGEEPKPTKLSKKEKMKLKKESKKKEQKVDDSDDHADAVQSDSVQLLNKSFFFRYVNPNLPIQTHESYPASIDPQEASLLRTCAQLCECSYGKKKYSKWPEEVGDPVFFKKDSDVARIPFYINNSDQLNTIFLTCRGTYCFDDFITDLMGNCAEVCGGKMHQGIYDTASYIFYNSQRLLVSLSKENHNRPIVFTGHSLGAAVSAALCEIMIQSFPDVPCRCIALAPPPTVDLSLWKITREHTKSFILEGDCIPFLSLENVINISVEILPTKIANSVNNWIHNRLKQTSVGAYEPMSTVQLTPPGELYLFVIDETGTAHLRTVGPEYFDCLTRGLADTMHAMNNYYATINNYFRNHT